MGSEIWTRYEHLIALDLYLNHPEIVEDKSDSTICATAELIGRSLDAIVFRLGNYRYLDPRSSQGLSNISEGCREIWEDYYSNESELSIEAERARQRLRSTKGSTEEDTGRDQNEIQTADNQVVGTQRQLLKRI